MALVLLWLALRSISWVELLQILRSINPWRLLLLILLNVTIVVTLSARWWYFLRILGYSLEYRTLVRYRLAGFAVSYLTPGPHFGGEPLQVYLVKRHLTHAEKGRTTSSRTSSEQNDSEDPIAISNERAMAAVLASITLDKAFDLLFNFLFLLGGTIFVLRQELLADRLAFWHISYVVALLFFPLALLVAYSLGRHPISDGLEKVMRLGRFESSHLLSRLHEISRQSEERVVWFCQERPDALFIATLVSLGNWGLLIGEFWFATYVVGMSGAFIDALFVLIATRIAILLPMPAGVGALEASLVLAMNVLGLNPAYGISLGVLIRSRDLIVGIVGLWLVKE